MDADTLSRAVIDGHEHRDLFLPREGRRQVRAPHHFHRLGNDGAVVGARASGRANPRRCKQVGLAHEPQLPARLVVYYVIALVLYAQASYGEVLRCLLKGVRWLRLAGTGPALASKSAVTRARARLGPTPLKELFARAACPLAAADTPEAWYRGRRLVSRAQVVLLRSAVEAELEAPKAAVTAKRLWIVKPFVLVPTLISLPLLKAFTRREAQSELHSPALALAQLYPLNAVPSNLTIVATESAIFELSGSKEDLSHKKRPHLAGSAYSTARSAWASNLHVMGRSNPRPILLLLDIPARPPFPADPLADLPNLGRGSRSGNAKQQTEYDGAHDSSPNRRENF